MDLTAAEGRVLGCLIEQETAAPDAVPLTLNTLRLACNRSSGRDPVVAYDDRTVEDTLLALKSRGLARFVPPSPEAPTTRYRHRADDRWRMGPTELAVLAVLLLRGVLTVGEVRTQVLRLDPVIDPAEVDAVLDSLAARTPRPFAARVPKRPGDHEARWVQVLTDSAPTPDELAVLDGTDGGAERPPAHPPGAPGRLPVQVAEPSYAALVARVADLEQRLADALDARAAAAADWGAPAFPPPPPPPVEVRAVAAPRRAIDARSDGGDRDDVADRLRDIERRLARIEAELGALR